MQSLHLVGLTEDRDGLVFSDGAGGESFVVRIDAALLEHVRLAGLEGGDVKARPQAGAVADGAGPTTGSARGRTAGTRATGAPPVLMAPVVVRPLVGGPIGGRPDAPAGTANPFPPVWHDRSAELGRPVEPDRPVARTSRLTPKEIQARLRIGRSVEEVAAEAGVDEAWVDRFALPVFAEQAAAIARARMMTMSTPRRGSSLRPLADAVPWVLHDRGVELTAAEIDAGWGARQHQAGAWVVSFAYRTRGRPKQAEWLYDGGDRTLVARNRLASELGWVGPTGATGVPARGGGVPGPAAARVATSEVAASDGGIDTLAEPTGESAPAAPKGGGDKDPSPPRTAATAAPAARRSPRRTDRPGRTTAASPATPEASAPPVSEESGDAPEVAGGVPEVAGDAPGVPGNGSEVPGAASGEASDEAVAVARDARPAPLRARDRERTRRVAAANGAPGRPLPGLERALLDEGADGPGHTGQGDEPPPGDRPLPIAGEPAAAEPAAAEPAAADPPAGGPPPPGDAGPAPSRPENAPRIRAVRPRAARTEPPG